MDPVSAFGIATGVIGLIPLCAQGFNMITACFEAQHDFRDSMAKITAQEILFIDWGAPMGLSSVSEKIAVDRLKERIPNWELVAPRVLSILAVMSDTFADMHILKDSYGIYHEPPSSVKVRLTAHRYLG
jgi:hypothetical protein